MAIRISIEPVSDSDNSQREPEVSFELSRHCDHVIIQLEQPSRTITIDRGDFDKIAKFFDSTGQ